MTPTNFLMLLWGQRKLKSQVVHPSAKTHHCLAKLNICSCRGKKKGEGGWNIPNSSASDPKGRSFLSLWDWLWRKVRTWYFAPFSLPTFHKGRSTTLGMGKAVDQDKHVILVRWHNIPSFTLWLHQVLAFLLGLFIAFSCPSKSWIRANYFQHF